MTARKSLAFPAASPAQMNRYEPPDAWEYAPDRAMSIASRSCRTVALLYTIVLGAVRSRCQRWVLLGSDLVSCSVSAWTARGGHRVGPARAVTLGQILFFAAMSSWALPGGQILFLAVMSSAEDTMGMSARFAGNEWVQAC